MFRGGASVSHRSGGAVMCVVVLQTHHLTSLVQNAQSEFQHTFHHPRAVPGVATRWSHRFVDGTEAGGGMLWESRRRGSRDHTKQLW